MTDVVYVGCKRPNGIILELEDNSGTIQKVTLKGSASSSHFVMERGNYKGLFGITEVPKDFWDAWEEKHKNFQPLKYGEIFVETKAWNLKKAGKERANELTGLEGVDPAKQEQIGTFKE